MKLKDYLESVNDFQMITIISGEQTLYKGFASVIMDYGILNSEVLDNYKDERNFLVFEII